jgi:hypothetical protein
MKMVVFVLERHTYATFQGSDRKLNILITEENGFHLRQYDKIWFGVTKWN